MDEQGVREKLLSKNFLLHSLFGLDKFCLSSANNFILPEAIRRFTKKIGPNDAAFRF